MVRPDKINSVVSSHSHKVKEGFFIEAGADDFQRDSNSLHFELQHGWTGLLVEPHPAVYPKEVPERGDF